MTQHQVRILRCLDDAKDYRAVCTCGWSMRSDLEDVQGRAAKHEQNELETIGE